MSGFRARHTGGHDHNRVVSASPDASAPPAASAGSSSASGAAPSSAATAARFAATALLWGASFLFIKVAVEGLSPSQVALGRLLFGAIALAIVMLVTRRRRPREAKYWMHVSVVATVFCVIPFLLFGYAGELIPSGLSSIYNATTPITTMLIALLVLPQERLTTARSLALVVAALGVLVVAAPWRFIGGDPGLSGSLLGQLACLGATLCYGIATVYARRFVSPFGYDPTTVATTQVGVGAVIMLVLAPAIALQPVDLTWPVIASVVALGVLGTGLAYVFYYGVLAAWGATLASTITYLTPVVGVLLGVLVLQETLSWNEPVGAAVVILGILIGQGSLRIPPRMRPVQAPEPAR